MSKTKSKTKSKVPADVLIQAEIDSAVEKSQTLAELMMNIGDGVMRALDRGRLSLSRDQRAQAAHRMLMLLASIAVRDISEPKLTPAQRASGQDVVDWLVTAMDRIEASAMSPSSTKAYRAALAAKVMEMAHGLLALPR